MSRKDVWIRLMLALSLVAGGVLSWQILSEGSAMGKRMSLAVILMCLVGVVTRETMLKKRGQ